MHCSISGHVTDDPVVSKSSGNIYDKSLLEKYLIAEGKCPVTGEEMTMDDVVGIKASKVVRPRPAAATSIPGMLSMFQDEWDAMMLETYTLKTHLDTTRQELVKTLYQHDAACRVIARLVAERDEARFHLTQLQQAAPAAAAAAPAAAAGNGGDAGAMDVDAGDTSGGVPKAVEAAMQAKFEELQSARKTRKAPPTLATADDLGKYEVTGTHPLHATTKAGIKCLAVDPEVPTTLVTGGNDGQVICFDKESGKVKKTLKAHAKPVTSITASAGAVLSTSVDKTIKIYVGSASDGAFDKGTAVKGVHSGEVTDLSLHPTGDYFATSSMDGSWAFTERASGKALLTVTDAGGADGYTCIQFHPDGLLAGVGTAGGAVQIFDVRKQEVVATVRPHAGGQSCSLGTPLAPNLLCQSLAHLLLAGRCLSLRSPTTASRPRGQGQCYQLLRERVLPRHGW